MAELSAVAVLVLGLLHEQPMHPYQLHQTLVERGDTRIVRVNPGAVYHGVERLERDGWSRWSAPTAPASAPSAPPTGSPTPAGPSSPPGSPACSATSTRPTRSSRSVWPRPTSCPPTRSSRSWSADGTARSPTGTGSPTSYDSLSRLGLPRRYLLDVEHDLATLRAEIDWLDRTITELQSGALDWTSPIPDSFHEAKRAQLRALDPPPKDIS